MNNYHKTNIKLIEVVEKFPELWDYSNEKYANKLHTERVWSEIGKEMDTTGTNCRMRWGTLRGNFSRALKPASSGPSFRIKKEYYLSPYLKFLLPFMKSKPSSVNTWTDAVQSQSLVEPIHSDPNEIVKKNDGREVYFETNFAQDGHSTPNSLSAIDKKPVMKFNHNDTFNDSAVDCTVSENEKHKQNFIDVEQANLNFFKSLLPDMARLDPKTSNEFKISIMGQLNDLIYGTDPLSKSVRITSNASQGYCSYGEQYSNQPMYHM